MSKRLEAKYKIDRRYGVNLWGRPKSPVNKRSYGPGQHGQRRGKPTDYGLQLAAKQKLRGYYGNITERQFRNIFLEASQKQGDTSAYLIEFLERRLDAVVYRLRWAPTVFAARQLVNHNHVLVNGNRVNIPSYRLRDGDVIELRSRMQENANVLASIESSERDTPEYLQVEGKASMKGTFLRAPSIEEVPYAVQMEPNMVIEYYSR
jgi:small subunit ribosomal protein S4